MKLSSRGKRLLESVNQNQGLFLEDLQQSLVASAFTTDIGIDQFEKLYQKKKIISETIDDYKQKNKYYQNDVQRAKQRIYQIAQLNDKANKQSIIMRNQINKINDAHMMSKILMMEKIVRLGLENQNMEKKRIQCHFIRQQKERVSSISQSIFAKKQRNRQLSVMESNANRSHIDQINYQTIQQNKSRAQRIKSQKQRRKQRFIRYEKFKQQQAQKNYLSKTQSLKKNLQDKQKLLQTLYMQQEKQKRHFQTTQNVTKEYLQNMYQTAAHSTLQNSSLFPTEAM